MSVAVQTDSGLQPSLISPNANNQTAQPQVPVTLWKQAETPA